MSLAAIAVEGLVKRYDGRAVVDGVSLSVATGEIVALLGPNGAGKTTIVETIEGYRAPDAGVVRVLGTDPVRGGRTFRARLGLMLQGGGIDIRARPLETLVQFAAFHRDAREPGELLDLVGLRHVARTPYRRLSGGERQRLGLALALVGRPEVVVLDEPTAGMDPEARAVTREIIARLRGDGVAVLLTSHDLTDVERLADRVDVLVDGRLVASGTVSDLTAGVRPSIRFRLDRDLSSDDQDALGQAVAARVVDGHDGGYRLDQVTPDASTVAGVTRWCADHGYLVADLRTTGGSLEEAYLDLVRGA